MFQFGSIDCHIRCLLFFFRLHRYDNRRIGTVCRKMTLKSSANVTAACSYAYTPSDRSMCNTVEPIYPLVFPRERISLYISSEFTVMVYAWDQVIFLTKKISLLVLRLTSYRGFACIADVDLYLFFLFTLLHS